MELKSCDVCGRVDAPKNFYEYSLYVSGKDEPVDEADLCPACAIWIQASLKELRKLKQRKAAKQ